MNKKKENKKIVSLRPFILTIFLSLFVILPNIIWWLFATPDAKNQLIKTTWMIYTIPIIWMIFIYGLSSIFVYFKVLSIKSLNWIIPLELVLLTLIISFKINSLYLRIGIIIIVVLITAAISNFMINGLLDYFEKKVEKQNNQKVL